MHIITCLSQKHSAETTLLKMQSDVLSALNTLPGWSAAFDTIYHELLLSCLRDKYEIRHQMLAWIRSYLSDKTERIRMKISIINAGAKF